MVVPDLEQICEIMLFSEGFDSAKVGSKAVVGACTMGTCQYVQRHGQQSPEKGGLGSWCLPVKDMLFA
jgi:hypothetical protein